LSSLQLFIRLQGFCPNKKYKQLQTAQPQQTAAEVVVHQPNTPITLASPTHNSYGGTVPNK
jgi:hypothetical protein